MAGAIVRGSPGLESGVFAGGLSGVDPVEPSPVTGGANVVLGTGVEAPEEPVEPALPPLPVPLLG